MIYEPLIGRSFKLGTNDCYSLLREYFQMNHQIVLPNYARPENFWEGDLNLYMTKATQNGFSVLSCHPSEFQASDVALMAINSTFANHAGVLLENGTMVHHLYGRLSAREPYRGVYRNTTIAVMRHKDVVIDLPESTAQIDDYVTAKAARFLNELRSDPSSQV